MHDIHLYVSYANSYALFCVWRTVVRLYTANPVFQSLFVYKKSLTKQEFPKGAKKMGVEGGVMKMENLKMVG